VTAYRFFYPTVSGLAIFKGHAGAGIKFNSVFGTLDTKPRHMGFTLNSDTPYGPILLDLRVGPMVVELPAGPLVGAALDVNQWWVADLGVPGPDGGKGGKHLLCHRVTPARCLTATTPGGPEPIDTLSPFAPYPWVAICLRP
jgi:hypothetical protein